MTQEADRRFRQLQDCGIKSGFRYRHYKGGLYVIVDLALDEGDMTPLVMYRSLDTGKCWVRTLVDFMSQVDLGDGHITQRFALMPFRPMRRFYLDRKEDVSGTSGVDRIAEGVELSDGTCALSWLTGHETHSFYKDIQELVQIHGHGGKTYVTWLDEAPTDAQNVDAAREIVVVAPPADEERKGDNNG